MCVCVCVCVCVYTFSQALTPALHLAITRTLLLGARQEEIHDLLTLLWAALATDRRDVHSVEPLRICQMHLRTCHVHMRPQEPISTPSLGLFRIAY